MNERQKRIEQLVGRWLEARTTEAEERELRELLRGEADLPEALRDVALLFEGFEALAAGRMPEERSAEERSDLALSGEPSAAAPADGGSAALRPSGGQSAGGLRTVAPHRRRTLWWMAAAAAVAAVGIILGVELLRQPYCYIDGRPVYDRDEALQTTVYFDSFAALETPDRLLDELIENH